MKELIYSALSEMGISFTDVEKEHMADVNIGEYIQDSIEQIMFVVALEEHLGFEIPDDVLTKESLSSLNELAALLEKAK